MTLSSELISSEPATGLRRFLVPNRRRKSPALTAKNLLNRLYRKYCHFEQKHNVTLPEDIAALLTHSQP